MSTEVLVLNKTGMCKRRGNRPRKIVKVHTMYDTNCPTCKALHAVTEALLPIPRSFCCDLQVRFTAQQLNVDLSHGAAAHTDKEDSDWVAPDWFSRSTTKYWVQPQHRMRIKCEIIKNLPVSIYGGQRRKLAAGQSFLPTMCLYTLSFAVLLAVAIAWSF